MYQRSHFDGILQVYEHDLKKIHKIAKENDVTVKEAVSALIKYWELGQWGAIADDQEK